MRKLIFALIFIFTLTVSWINFKLHSDNFTNAEKQDDVVVQLNFIEAELKSNNLGDRMQKIFPEGFVFTNTLYGLSWCELAYSTNNNQLRSRALNEALFAYNEINSDKARAKFHNELIPKNGIYYVGWNNYLLSKILKLDTTFAGFSEYKDTFTDQCEIISEALKQSSSPYLQSYENQSWPADMFVAMASIKNHDNIFKPKYKKETSEWIKNVKNKLDPRTNLIPHKTDPITGRTVEGARGSSISLAIRLLAEIDSGFAKQQYTLYKTYFVSTTLGLPSIREYPKGQIGCGDIDSGPVLFGVGFSGTIVSIGTFSKLGNFDLAEKQYKTINAFGFENRTKNEKKYVFGLMPIADAFIAWGRATELNSGSPAKTGLSVWTFKFHIISILASLILWTLFYSKSIMAKWRN